MHGLDVSTTCFVVLGAALELFPDMCRKLGEGNRSSQLLKVSHVKIDRIVYRFAVRPEPLGSVDGSKPVNRRQGYLGAMGRYFRVKILGCPLRVVFGLIPVLGTLT